MLGGIYRKTDRLIWPATAVLVALIPSLAVAQVTLDGTTGPGGELDGPDYQITDDLGTRAGDNLFHSFEDFSIDTGESATFSGPDEIANVVSRVTGDNASDIDGTLRSTMPDADFYFINPNGVTFGPNATLDVQGSFHVSTADELRFGDGQVFSATDPDASGLSVAEPRAFGFFDAAPGAILVDRSTLEVGEGETLSLVGGDVTVDGGVPGGVNQTDQGLIQAEAGVINLIAIDRNGQFEFETGDTTALTMANIALTGGAIVRTSGDGGGAINLRSASLEVDAGSVVSASNSGPTDATGGIDIVTGRMVISEGAQVAAVTDFSSGDAGDITITAKTIEILDQGRVVTSTFAGGNAGSINIRADRITVDSRGIAGLEDGLDARFPSIASRTLPGSTGDAGKVIIQTGILELKDGGVVTSSTAGDGDAGGILVKANKIILDGRGTDFLITGISSQAGSFATGNAGEIEIETVVLDIDDGALITTATFGVGDAGKVSIAADQIRIEGETLFRGGILSASTPQSIETFADAGDAGTVSVTTNSLEIRGNNVIASSTTGGGDAGSVIVDADKLSIDGRDGFPTGIFSDTSTFATGDAGEVVVNSRDLVVLNQGEISSSADGIGDAGKVTVSARSLHMNRGIISSGALGGGVAGDVVVSSDTVDVQESRIITSAQAGEGGRIRIVGSRYVVIADSEVTSNGIEPGERASLIDLEGELIALNDSRFTSLTGDGEPLIGSGAIDVKGDYTLISNDSEVEASSSVAISGLLNDFSNQLIVLDSQFADASRLLRENCEGGGDLGGSSFVSRGASPAISPGGGLLPGFYSGAFVTEKERTDGDDPIVLVVPCS